MSARPGHRLWILLGATAALLALPAIAVGGIGFIYVEADDQNKFSPKTESYNLNASPNFLWVWGDEGDDGVSQRRHNVRQDRKLFYSGPPRKTDPTPDGFEVSASAGTYRYYCENHGGPGGEGMSGKVQVTPELDGQINLDRIPVAWATVFEGGPPHTTGNQYDVRFRVNDGEWRNWKRNTSKLKGAFGRNDNPVNLVSGRTYRFKARSEKSSNPDRRSGWSPVLTVPLVP